MDKIEIKLQSIVLAPCNSKERFEESVSPFLEKQEDGLMMLEILSIEIQ